MRITPIAYRAPQLFAALIVLLLGGCATDDAAPMVTQTIPSNGDRHVDPALSELSVTFNEQMQDRNWSWVYENKGSFPQIAGEPNYVDNLTRNVLPVRLEPNKEYVVWINAANFANFKDQAGNPAVPYKLTFRTSPADG